MPDPDPTRNQGPKQPEASNPDALDGVELTDEQLDKAAGGDGSSFSDFGEFTGLTESRDTPRSAEQ